MVWLARDEELEREVALKFLPDLTALDKTVVGELKRETRRSLELTHKNIVRIYDFVQSENSACISMEYIDGDTLSNLRAEKEGKVFQPDEIAAWTSQLCEALAYAHHDARIIHRDLKPGEPDGESERQPQSLRLRDCAQFGRLDEQADDGQRRDERDARLHEPAAV